MRINILTFVILFSRKDQMRLKTKKIKKKPLCLYSFISVYIYVLIYVCVLRDFYIINNTTVYFITVRANKV